MPIFKIVVALELEAENEDAAITHANAALALHGEIDSFVLAAEQIDPDGDDWHEQAQDEMESRAYWQGRP